MSREGLRKVGSGGNGGEYPTWRATGGHPHGSSPGNDTAIIQALKLC